MTLEIFLESDTNKKRVLVERWVFRHDSLVSAGPTPISDSQSLSVSAAYKQLVVFFRTLHAELRALPAHRYARRAAERSASGNPARGGFAVAFEVSGERTPEGVATGEDSKPPPLERAEEKWSEPLPHSNGEEGGRASDTSTSLGMSGVSSSGILSSGLLHSSSSEGTGSIPSADAPKRTRPSPREDASSDAYRTYAFAAAAAPGGGRLDASVYFLDADALAALDLGDMRETCKACKPTLVDAYAHEARGGSGSGSDGYASSPGGFFVGDKKTTSAFPRRAGSWKARATQFLATSPGSAKVGFAARAEPEDVDTPPPPAASGSCSPDPETPGRRRPGEAADWDCSARRWRGSSRKTSSAQEDIHLLPLRAAGSSTPRPSWGPSGRRLAPTDPGPYPRSSTGARSRADPRRLPRRRDRRSRRSRRRRRPSSSEEGRRRSSASPSRTHTGFAPARPRAPLQAAGFFPRSPRGSRRPRGWPSRGWGAYRSRSGAGPLEAAEAEANRPPERAWDARQVSRSRRRRTRSRRADRIGRPTLRRGTSAACWLIAGVGAGARARRRRAGAWIEIRPRSAAFPAARRGRRRRRRSR